METNGYRAIAIVGAGAILPDAPNVPAFWNNVRNGRYSITDTPAERWDPALYYDPDPAAPDKTYSRIGGWVLEYEWDPIAWKLPIPPRVVAAMDDAQKWAVACTRQALEDYGYPKRPMDPERTAVILGNAMAGEKHYLTAFRICFPEYARELSESPSFEALPSEVQAAVLREMHQRIGRRLPEVTEDSMPGELANCLAGRVANVFNFRGPNFVADAACASAMAAIHSAAEGLIAGDFDAAITGGIDRNMSCHTFVKFCKIGALSATGSRPYAAGADGFVMGEGAAVFVVKRLADAERDGDRIYAVLRGIGASSDGKGKGITAPNPIGQKLAIERAWQNAGLSPATATLFEGHGTSTRVGDVVEVESLAGVLKEFRLLAGSVKLGSVKSNIGHLKGASGAAGLLKTALALRDKVLPPSVQFEKPNPDIDFDHLPLAVNTSLQPWELHNGDVRRAGVSAFGFGGTNFHAVLEEYVPHNSEGNGKRSIAVSVKGVDTNLATADTVASATKAFPKAPLRGALVVGAASEAALAERLRELRKDAESGAAPPPIPPGASDLHAPIRVAIDYADAGELAAKLGKALQASQSGQPAAWKALRPQGIFRGEGPAPKKAFLYTGQGSQYVNMLRELRGCEPVVAAVFDQADRTMTPLLGRPLSDFIFVDESRPAILAKAEDDLRQTAITQPAVLAVDLALTRLLAAYGIEPDMTMGHSLGEYGALVAAGALPFEDALEAVSARGREMTRVAMADNGRMAAVFAPVAEIERVLRAINGYVVIANVNSETQAVIGGASVAVEQAMEALQRAGFNVVPLPVSHAFHTEIVAPASEPLRQVLERLRLSPPRIPVVANVNGEFYPTGSDAVPQMLDILGRQIYSTVQFVKGLHTLYEAGARVFIETGPKKALHGFAEDVLGGRGDVLPLFTNHPKNGDIPSFNQALCGLYAAGLGNAAEQPEAIAVESKPAASFSPVAITGASLGLPGTERIFDDANVARLLHGEQLIDVIPLRHRRAMLDKHITRLVKSANGDPTFEPIASLEDVVKLAGRGGAFDLEHEFGISADRIPSLDRATGLAIAAGMDALRDAGIPLVLRYKTTTKGTRLPDRWMLPESLRDDTGVIFACVFPGLDSFADEQSRYYADRARREQMASLESLREYVCNNGGNAGALREIERRIAELRAEIESEPYTFDRRFLFRVLSMGHSQFAELIGARGPNTQINAACATTTAAVALAEDWIRLGRCRRVIVISADDVSSDHLIDWFGAGFLASGAAATDGVVEEAAVPFDRRRHGMIIGMGAAAMVVESAEAARERGIRPICEVLSAVTANSAFHGTRLDVEHISGIMEELVSQAEARTGIDRRKIAPQTVFVSHETYTPARGGSASAEIHALRRVFGDDAGRIVITNTKGYTGHAMGAGVEDVIAIKALETGCVPPVANFREVDPELGQLNLSRGGAYPIEYALRLAAGFGSQISMTLLRWIPAPDGVRPAPQSLGYRGRIAEPEVWDAWLSRITGQGHAELEVVQRTLRVREEDAVAAAPAPVSKPVPEPVSSPKITPQPTNSLQSRNREGVVVAPTDNLSERVLAIVAEKTGYPVDMLNPELDLEADLGIDTVKQAEMFAAIREAYQIPRDQNLKLRDFPTLAHVIRFARERQVQAPTPPAPIVVRAADTIQQAVLAIVAEKTGYPVDMLDPELDLEADLGIDTVKQAEMFAAIREAYHIPRDQNPKLRDFPTLAHVIRFARERAAAPPPVAAPAADPVQQAVLAIVAQKTGYPIEMLDPELDLEADLGIDTVKQAEMFAAIREAYHISRDQNLKVRDFPTLAHVIRFARERAAAPATASPAPAAETPKPAASFDAAATVPRRVPIPALLPPPSLCKPTGVTLGAGTRVAIMPDIGGVAEALHAQLDARGVEVVWLDRNSEPDPGKVDGIYWLPALDDEGSIFSMDEQAWREALRLRVKLLYSAMRAAPADSFLISATRFGGQHGYGDDGATAPLGGAVSGFTKTYKRERPEALVKVVDFEAQRSPDEVAQHLLDETLHDPGVVEAGYHHGLRFTVRLEERPVQDGFAGLTLDRNSVFLVTGAAGSIVSAITADLAAASGGTFYLLDVAPEPVLGDPDIQRFATDREGLKRELFARLQARGERATPAMVEKQLAALERAHAAASAIQAIRAAGGTAQYFSLDLRDGKAVNAAMDQVRLLSGRIDVLLHAAGLERSHLLPDKEPAEFDLVFDVKADGWFHLLHAIGDMPLAAVVAFSSVAGRFGNAGQADYSAANDLLCKFVSSFRNTRPATRALVMDWTAWGGIGMATRGSIPQMMALAGIEMLPPEAGVPWIRRELTAGGSRGEVVVARALGVLLERWNTAALEFSAAVHGPLLSETASLRVNGGLVMETLLDPAIQPFLHDHRIEGTAVLPGVMGVEAFAEACLSMLPGSHIEVVEDVRFLVPFKFYRDEPRSLTVEVSFRPQAGAILADCRLLGSRRLANQAEPQVTTHFTARLRLHSEAPQRAASRPPAEPEGPVLEAADIYRVYFHGPAYRVMQRAWLEGEKVIGQMAGSLPVHHHPHEAPLALEPRLIELCFQTAGLLDLVQGRLALPHEIGSLRRYATPEQGEAPLFAVVTPVPDGCFDAEVVDSSGNCYLSLSGYRTVALPGTFDAEPLKALNGVMA